MLYVDSVRLFNVQFSRDELNSLIRFCSLCINCCGDDGRKWIQLSSLLNEPFDYFSALDLTLIRLSRSQICDLLLSCSVEDSDISSSLHSSLLNLLSSIDNPEDWRNT